MCIRLVEINHKSRGNWFECPAFAPSSHDCCLRGWVCSFQSLVHKNDLQTMTVSSPAGSREGMVYKMTSATVNVVLGSGVLVIKNEFYELQRTCKLKRKFTATHPCTQYSELPHLCKEPVTTQLTPNAGAALTASNWKCYLYTPRY